MNALLIFGEDVLPDPRQIDGLDDEEVAAEPSDDFHLAVGPVVEELEDVQLVLQEVEDD